MDTVGLDSRRRYIWWRGLSGFLLLFAVWGIWPGETWPQAQEAGAVAFQTDGKIVTVASGGFAVARYYSDGTLDHSFGTGGKVVTRLCTVDGTEDASNVYEGAGMVTLQSDGKIVAAGQSDRSFAVVRYNPDGTLDPSFGEEGKVTTRIGTDPEIEDAASALALQADGKIVVVGRTWQPYTNDIAVVRYNPDGSLDASFGKGGKVIDDLSAGYDDAFDIVVQPNGKLVAGGLAAGEIALMRYHPNGSSDFSFNSRVMLSRGKVGKIVGHALALQSDGKIVVVGGAGVFALARYNSDGSLDSSFGADGTVSTQLGRVDRATDTALQPDGKLVVVGTSFNGRSIDFAMIRYNSDGSVDFSFGKGGKVTSDFCAHTVEEKYAAAIGPGSISGGWRVGLQADGKIVVTGTPSSVRCHSVMFRYTPDGSLDTSFGEQGRVSTAIATDDGYLAAQTIQGDGKIVVAGTSTGGFALACYHSEGSLDLTFGTGGKVTTRIGAGYLVQ